MYILFCLQTGPIYLKVSSQILVDVQMLFHWYENSLVLLMGQPGRIDFISSPMSQFLKLESVLAKIMDLYLPSHFSIFLRLTVHVFIRVSRILFQNNIVLSVLYGHKSYVMLWSKKKKKDTIDKYEI